MLFNSLEYLVFFPFVIIIYYLVPGKWRRYWLLAASLFFYGSWRAEYLGLILFTVAVTFLAGRMLERVDGHRKKIVLGLSLVANLGILFFFKYFNFLASTVNSILDNASVPLLDILLPVGISFYTFQAIGYTIDVYRGTLPAEKNVITYAVFVCYFPQLVAGPIERAKNLLPQFREEKKLVFSNVHQGLVRIGWGFFCKLVIADRLALFVNTVFSEYQQYDSGILILAAILFQIEIYCDFASYSNIALGSAQVMGFRLMRNFNAPFLALSISDFWSRWHISLSKWLGDYVFTPLVWSRWANKLAFGKKWEDHKPHYLINYLIVFLISGIWHGANWTFVIWGLLHGVYSILSHLTVKPRRWLRRKLHIDNKNFFHKTLCRCYVFAITAFAHIFFRAPSVSAAFGFIGGIFSRSASSGSGLFELGLDRPDFIVVIIAIAILFIVDGLNQKRDVLQATVALPLAVRWTIYLLLIAAIAIFGIYGPAYDTAPFIYFQF